MRYTFLFLFFITIALQAQITTPPPQDPEEEFIFEKPKSGISQKLHYGGNFWLGFFGAFYVDASPMLGIDVTDKGTIAGIGATFIYQGAWREQGSIAAGPRLFVRQAVWRNIFAHAEFEVMNAPSFQFYSYNQLTDGRRKWGASPLIGGGFYQNRSRQQKGSFIALMYNLGYNFGNGFISPQGFGGNQSPLVLRFGFFM